MSEAPSEQAMRTAAEVSAGIPPKISEQAETLAAQAEAQPAPPEPEEAHANPGREPRHRGGHARG